MGESLYIPFWKEQLPFIKATIASGHSDSKQLDIADLQSYSRDGNRQTLRFRVTLVDGGASTNTNSAIARDLRNLLNSESQNDIQTLAKGKEIVINLINGDTLNIEM